MSFLNPNLSILRTYQPDLSDAVKSAPQAPQLELLPIQDQVKDLDAVIVVGEPTPESWNRLLVEPSTQVVVQSGELSAIRSYLTVMDLRQVLSTGRVSFAVGDEGVLQILNDLFGTLYRRRLSVVGNVTLPGYAVAVKEMQFFNTLCASNRSTLDEFALDWQEHLSANLPDYLHGPFLQDESGAWEGQEAVIAAAGPTLDEIDIPAAFGKSKVIACDTAVPVLSERGCVPDMIVTLDASAANQAYFYSLPPEVYSRSVLCVTPLVDRKVYRPFKHTLFYSYGHPTLDHFRGCGVPFDPLATGGSVALTAIDVARVLGVQKAYLIGYDFQYYRFRTHARGTGTAFRAIRTVNRFQTVELSLYDYQVDLDSQGPEQSETGAAITDRKFQKWRDWLELYVKNNDIRLYQMSKQSARINGIEPGRPSGCSSDRPLMLSRRPFHADLRRELKFLLKELELALHAPESEFLRRVQALPRSSNCMGYVLAWLADKPPESAVPRLRRAVESFHRGISDAMRAAASVEPGGQGL